VTKILSQMVVTKILSQMVVTKILSQMERLRSYRLGLLGTVPLTNAVVTALSSRLAGG
jgi:hypothetical protein